MIPLQPKFSSIASIILITFILFSSSKFMDSSELYTASMNTFGQVATRISVGVPSLASPNPIYATSKPRPLVHGARKLGKLDFRSWIGINSDGTASVELMDDEAWIYFTTSDYDVRSNITGMFDDGFQEMVPAFEVREKQYIKSYAFVDCAQDPTLCGIGFDSLFFGNGGCKRGNHDTGKVAVNVPGLMHIKFHPPCPYDYHYEWNCAASYHFWTLPLRERDWWRSSGVEIKRSEEANYMVTFPLFPSATEQIRNIMLEKAMGRDRWKGKGDWTVVIEPTSEGQVQMQRFANGSQELYNTCNLRGISGL